MISNNILFCGLLYRERKFRNNAISLLTDIYSDIEIFSDAIDFSSFSDYYNEEMGEDIIREWIAFSEPVMREHLFEKKLASIEIENRMKMGGCRTINIDPGIITLHNVQLLTTKDFSHRIYLDEGIFAEITFLFRKSSFEFLDWTYPDYKTLVAQTFFRQARDYLKKINKTAILNK